MWALPTIMVISLPVFNYLLLFPFRGRSYAPLLDPPYLRPVQPPLPTPTQGFVSFLALQPSPVA